MPKENGSVAIDRRRRRQRRLRRRHSERRKIYPLYTVVYADEQHRHDGIHTYDCDSHARLTSYDGGRMKVARAGPVAPPSTGITDDLTYGL